jgi:hypothetical protein
LTFARLLHRVAASVKRVSSVLYDLVRRNEFWMTFATALAAIAAIFSAIAASHQERAVFNSALFSKQVDEVANFEKATRAFLKLYKAGQEQADKATLESALVEWRDAALRLNLISPSYITSFTGYMVYSTLDRYISGDWKPKTDPDRFPGVIDLEIRALDGCAKAQFSQAHNLEGSLFRECVQGRLQPERLPDEPTAPQKSPPLR